MDSIIREIYYDISDRVKPTVEYNRETDNYYNLLSEIEKRLPNEYKKLVMEISEGFGAVLSESDLMYFKEGFKKGLLIGIECMSN